MMNGFDRQNARGMEVQEIVKKHLEARGNRITDVSQNPEYQKVDIDFIVEKGGSRTYLEIKMDNNFDRTGNLFFECGKQRENYFSSGWLNYCKAQYICFYDKLTRHGIIVDFKRAVDLLQTHGKLIKFWDKIDNSEDKAMLLPLNIVRTNNIIAYEFKN